ncbi:MAG: hypothetical protein NTW98_02780 [Candidatus Nomurabacteria bacterium]|nr:hypothetical protein [Candidatus Nomurabacteria bacterium]
MEKHEGIDYLNYLEKTGKYVFHSSPFVGIDTLVPKQGRHFPNPKDSEEFILDGDPAVSATPYAEFAIFRALINKNNTPNVRSGFGFNNKEKEFRVSNQKVLDAIKDKKALCMFLTKAILSHIQEMGKHMKVTWNGEHIKK